MGRPFGWLSGATKDFIWEEKEEEEKGIVIISPCSHIALGSWVNSAGLFAQIHLIWQQNVTSVSKRSPPDKKPNEQRTPVAVRSGGRPEEAEAKTINSD